MSGRHEQVVCIAKRDEGDIDRDVGVHCLERLDRLKEDVFLLAFSSERVPNRERDGAVGVDGGGCFIPGVSQATGQNDGA